MTRLAGPTAERRAQAVREIEGLAEHAPTPEARSPQKQSRKQKADRSARAQKAERKLKARLEESAKQTSTQLHEAERTLKARWRAGARATSSQLQRRIERLQRLETSLRAVCPGNWSPETVKPYCHQLAAAAPHQAPAAPGDLAARGAHPQRIEPVRIQGAGSLSAFDVRNSDKQLGRRQLRCSRKPSSRIVATRFLGGEK